MKYWPFFSSMIKKVSKIALDEMDILPQECGLAKFKNNEAGKFYSFDVGDLIVVSNKIIITDGHLGVMTLVAGYVEPLDKFICFDISCLDLVYGDFKTVYI